MQYTSDEEEHIKPTSAPKGKEEVVTKSSPPLALPAIAAVTVAAVVGIGARWFLGRRRSKQGVSGGARAKKSGRVGGVANARRVPPRRARSVASSVDGGAVKRYVLLRGVVCVCGLEGLGVMNRDDGPEEDTSCMGCRVLDTDLFACLRV